MEGRVLRVLGEGDHSSGGWGALVAGEWQTRPRKKLLPLSICLEALGDAEQELSKMQSWSPY